MSFQVIFTGSLRDGFNRRRGIESLHKQFSLGFDQIKRLLAGAHQVVKCVDDRRQAERVVRALWSGGWHSELHLDDRVVFRTSEPRRRENEDTVAGMFRQWSDDSAVSICVPESWQQCTDLNPHAMLQAGNRNDHHYMVVLKQAREGLPPALTLQDYSAAQLQQCVDKVVFGRVTSGPSVIGHSGLPACTAEMCAQMNGVSVHYLVASFQCEQCFYTVFLWCDQREFQVQKPVFMQMVASFRTGAASAMAGDEVEHRGSLELQP